MELTQKWIDQYNQKCAEFLGFEISENKECFKLLNKNEWIALDVFRSDWNWIHKVIDNILDLPDGMGWLFKGSVSDCFHSKEETVKKINYFIDWYNKKK